jgi:hypothetical protein
VAEHFDILRNEGLNAAFSPIIHLYQELTMKLAFCSIALLTLSLSAFAQYAPYELPWPYPGEYRHEFPSCSHADINATLAQVEAVCHEKLAEVAVKHSVTCELRTTALKGCRATCYQGQNPYVALRVDTGTDCFSHRAWLRKTVFSYY